ncbi:MAG: phosphoenolpyruvate--protein phosphotransferase [Treponema sp.]|jgi:phosphotransferase system enzyme I (PtsI)|nr:phosphoenolpyruvate--protein phosphotransferase [Treponema sp.]
MQINGTCVCGGIGLAPPVLMEEFIPINLDEHETLPVEQSTKKLLCHISLLENEMISRSEELLQQGKNEEAEMFSMYLAMLLDTDFQDGICDFVNQGYALPAAIKREAKVQEQMLLDTEDPYMAERSGDVEDIAYRLIYHILGRPFPSLASLERPSIVVAEDMQASALLGADYKKVRGIVLSGGSKTAHLSILAASLEIPMLINCGDLGPVYKNISRDAALFLNAGEGYVWYSMTAEEELGAEKKKNAFYEKKKKLEPYKTAEARTRDGRRILLNGNIVETTAIDNILNYGGDGVGLFRTEFLFMNKKNLPSEDEQYAVYYTAAKKLGAKPLVIRTIDIGADKPVEALHLEAETNPFLGFRAIRLCLHDTELFTTQLRAILRASILGNIRILIPMIATMEELDKTLELINGVKVGLNRQKIEFDKHIAVGIMIEIPAAAIRAWEFIKKVDFFSIGSNDLTQYTLAVDRMNEKVQYLYNSTDPAVLRLIQNAIDACTEEGKYCSLCGEMAADEGALSVLIGMGLTNISINPTSILSLKRFISGLDYSALRAQYKLPQK